MIEGRNEKKEETEGRKKGLTRRGGGEDQSAGHSLAHLVE